MLSISTQQEGVDREEGRQTGATTYLHCPARFGAGWVGNQTTSESLLRPLCVVVVVTCFGLVRAGWLRPLLLLLFGPLRVEQTSHPSRILLAIT